MKLAHTLLFGLLLGLPLVLGGCFRCPVVDGIYLIYYPQEPRVCPEGVLVTLEPPKNTEVFSALYRERPTGAVDERVPMLTATSFLMTKPAKAPATPEEAETWKGYQEWDGYYMVGIRFDDIPGDVGMNFYCQGSGRTVGEHTTTKEAGASLVVVENPNRDSGLEVRPVQR